jgi:hypothetical protein
VVPAGCDVIVGVSVIVCASVAAVVVSNLTVVVTSVPAVVYRVADVAEAVATDAIVALDGTTERTPKPNAATATSEIRLKVVFVDMFFLSLVDPRNFRGSAWAEMSPS